MRKTIPRQKPDLEQMFNDAVTKYRGKRIMMSVFSENPKGHRPHNTGIEICAVVQDVRVAYGRINLLAKPVKGRGMAWVRVDRVRVVQEWDVDHESEHAAATTEVGHAGNSAGAGVAATKRSRR